MSNNAARYQQRTEGSTRKNTRKEKAAVACDAGTLAEVKEKYRQEQYFRMKREAALMEIMRGCTSREIREYKRKYAFDLRGKGYYLFYWELQNAEYNKHYYNKTR